MKITMISNIEWRILLPSITAAITIPMDLIFRFIVPIASGIVWIFLKPRIVKLRDNYNKKNNKS